LIPISEYVKKRLKLLPARTHSRDVNTSWKVEQIMLYCSSSVLHYAGSAMPTQKEIMEALLKPEAYDENPENIEMCQTHISFVFLTQKFVYKIKKAVNFGFLDFSSLEKRRFYCEKELELNRRLCPDMYLEVVPINKLKTFKIKGEGEPVEYAVKMKRMPQDKIMTKLLDEGKVDQKTVSDIAKVIADFHAKAETNPHVSEFGSLGIIETNWTENFEQTEDYINKTVTQEEFNLIRQKTDNYMNTNRQLFEKRAKEGRIRDCHGDIHSGNIFITDKIYIFDAIEFNERFRFSDVTADMGFLAMDLDFRGQRDLSEVFVKKYIEYHKDKELTKLLPFYKCYRAYVRGKVVGFRLNDPNIGGKEKEEAVKEAQAYFKLAYEYTKEL
jgi:aminoglycoside phosphotransferase family enzyme